MERSIDTLHHKEQHDREMKSNLKHASVRTSIQTPAEMLPITCLKTKYIQTEDQTVYTMLSSRFLFQI